MKQFLFDGTFEGMLTGVFLIYEQKEWDAVLESETQLENYSLFETVLVKTDDEKFQRVFRTLQEKMSPAFLQDVYFAYLSDLPGSADAALKYIRLGLKEGRNIRGALQNPIVRSIRDLRKKVGNEAHRLKGLVRFHQMQGGVFVADLEPDHNVITLLAPHFAARLKNEFFIIRDLRRYIAVVYDKKEWYLVPLGSDITPADSKQDEFAQLWQLYFKKIAVPGRENRRLQLNYMPRRYHKYLTELQ